MLYRALLTMSINGILKPLIQRVVHALPNKLRLQSRQVFHPTWPLHFNWLLVKIPPRPESHLNSLERGMSRAVLPLSVEGVDTLPYSCIMKLHSNICKIPFKIMFFALENLMKCKQLVDSIEINILHIALLHPHNMFHSQLG